MRPTGGASPASSTRARASTLSSAASTTPTKAPSATATWNSRPSRPGCLTLVTNAIVTWTTEYYGLAVAELRAGGRLVDDAVLAHISPAHSENVNFFGSITVDVERELARLDAGGYRPLRSRGGALAAAGGPRRAGVGSAAVTRRRRWVQYEVPLFVRVDIDDAYDIDGEVTKVVLAIPAADPDLGGPSGPVSLARDARGQALVYDGDPGAAMAPTDDDMAARAVGVAGFRGGWPARSAWEEDSDPRVEIGLYDHDDLQEEDLDETAF